MRHNRMFVLGATLLTAVLVLGACSKSGGDGTSSSSGPKPTVASLLTLGGPPECPTRPFCEPGLKSTYGLTFKDFKPLDVGGPQTVAALDSGAIQVGLLFTGYLDASLFDRAELGLAGVCRKPYLEELRVAIQALVQQPEDASILSAGCSDPMKEVARGAA